MVFLDLPRRAAKVLSSQMPDDDGVIRLKQRQTNSHDGVGATRQSVNAGCAASKGAGGSSFTTGP
jgi:hypothetical protein